MKAPRHKYTKEQDEFILSTPTTSKEKVEEFNKKFGTSLGKGSLSKRLETLKTRVENPHNKVYYQEELDYLHSILPKYKHDSFDWAGCAEDFNKHTGRHVSPNRLKRVINDILKAKVGCSRKTPPNVYNIGDTICNNGRIYIKISNVKGGHTKNYKQKNRYMYEQYHNVILKPDEYIVHLDGDYTNYSKDNLYKITKGELHYVKRAISDVTTDASIKKILLLDAQLRAILDKEEKEEFGDEMRI